MKLSDVMSAAGLAGYAEIGLCIFLFVFVAVAVRTFRRGQQHEFAHLADLPLQSDETDGSAPRARIVQG
jgi:cbb3-type cytochrome oxidase subunit 3